MSPNLEGPIAECGPGEEISITLTPISDHSSSSSEVNFGDAIEEGDIDVILLPEETVHIPLEQNLRELLIRVTNTEDLLTVTQIKLRVISRELTLQHLSIYTPALRELILDGSIVATLRDIGSGLKNLKILRVNRCGLTCIDGVFGLENLEELYATDNAITNLAPCAFLSNVRIIDIRRNVIPKETLRYLSLCHNLEELFMEGNPGMDSHGRYIEIIQLILPDLKKIDGKCNYWHGAIFQRRGWTKQMKEFEGVTHNIFLDRICQILRKTIDFNHREYLTKFVEHLLALLMDR